VDRPTQQSIKAADEPGTGTVILMRGLKLGRLR